MKSKRMFNRVMSIEFMAQMTSEKMRWPIPRLRYYLDSV